MKLKYRVWRLKGPTSSILGQYSCLPIGMLENEPAFMDRRMLTGMLKQIEDGGKRVDNEWTFIYVKIPGLLSTIMDPHIDRWASFGPGWDAWERLKDMERKSELPNFVSDPEQWVMLVKYFDRNKMVTATLKDWMDAKNYYAWRDANHKREMEMNGWR